MNVIFKMDPDGVDIKVDKSPLMGDSNFGSFLFAVPKLMYSLFVEGTINDSWERRVITSVVEELLKKNFLKGSVLCTEENNTPEIIDGNGLVIEVTLYDER